MKLTNIFTKATKKLLALALTFTAAAFLFAQEADNIVSVPADFDAMNVPEIDEVKIPEKSVKFGFQFGTGISTSCVLKPYLSEDIAFRIDFNDVVALDFGVNAIGNVLYRGAAFEPWAYISPIMDFYAAGWYIGVGACLPIDPINGFQIAWFARTGYDFGNWNVLGGKLNMRAGISVSPTVYGVETPEDGDAAAGIGAGLGTILLTIFNIPKIDIGVTYYLPL